MLQRQATQKQALIRECNKVTQYDLFCWFWEITNDSFDL